MRNYVAKNVDEYINSADERARPTLIELRRIMLESVSEVGEQISWGIPFYRYHGLLAGYSVFKNHATFGLAFVFSDLQRKAFEEKGYTTGKKTVQIRYDQAVPTALISKMLKERAKLNKASGK